MMHHFKRGDVSTVTHISLENDERGIFGASEVYLAEQPNSVVEVGIWQMRFDEDGRFISGWDGATISALNAVSVSGVAPTSQARSMQLVVRSHSGASVYMVYNFKDERFEKTIILSQLQTALKFSIFDSIRGKVVLIGEEPETGAPSIKKVHYGHQGSDGKKDDEETFCRE